MVSFSCENCGDVLTKKKLDPHRNQCYGASYTCLDCMVHFPGTSYRTHTACITEDQKYQGKLYKEKKPKGQQQKNNSQALTPHNAYAQDTYEADNAVALVDAPPRAPTPPPAAHSLGYHEQAALPPVNVFDFLDNSQTPNAPRTMDRMIEDSAPPAYAETPMPAIADVMSFQIPDDASFIQPSNERDSFTTPAPKSKKSKKDKDGETTSKKSERKRKRSPAELDLSAARAQDRDAEMEDAPPVLHSGLTGGLNRLLARPEFPPSPEDSGEFANSPLSPMKRAKQGSSNAFVRAQKEWEDQQKKDKKSEKVEKKEKKEKKDKKEKKEKKEKEKEKEKEKDRGRQKERKASTALVKIRPKKRKDGSSEIRRVRQYSSSVSPAPEERKLKAIEYNRSSSSSPAPDGNGQLVVRPQAGELALPVSTRAELFMSFVKSQDCDRGVSVNKALKKYHRELHSKDTSQKADEEKELWKEARLKRNDRGEIVLFFGSESS